MKACPYCAEEVQDAAVFCKHCHRDLTPRAVTLPAPAAVDEPTPDGAFSKEHYRRAFAKFDANGGAFAPTWNWGAFFFLFIWYIYRGMWAKGGLILLITLATAGAAGLLFCVYGGVAGDYDFYQLKRKHTQFWK